MKRLFVSFYLIIFMLAVFSSCHHIGKLKDLNEIHRPLKHIRNSEDLENAEHDSVQPIYDKEFLNNIVKKLRLYIKKMLESVNLLAENDVTERPSNQGNESDENTTIKNDEDNDKEDENDHITKMPTTNIDDVEKIEKDEEHRPPTIEECEDVQNDEDAETDEKTTHSPQKNTTSHYNEHKKEFHNQNTTKAPQPSSESNDNNEKRSVNYNRFSKLFLRSN